MSNLLNQPTNDSANLRNSVEKPIESSLSSFLDTFSDSVTRVNAIPNSTPEQKAQLLEAMYKRIPQAQTDSQRVYDDVLDEFKRELLAWQESLKEIGDRNRHIR